MCDGWFICLVGWMGFRLPVPGCIYLLDVTLWFSNSACAFGIWRLYSSQRNTEGQREWVSEGVSSIPDNAFASHSFVYLPDLPSAAIVSLNIMIWPELYRDSGRAAHPVFVVTVFRDLCSIEHIIVASEDVPIKWTHPDKHESHENRSYR